MTWAVLILTLLAPQDPLLRGMTDTDVRKRFGPPAAVSRQILQGSYIEQWRYPKLGLWIHFDGARGQELRVRSVHPPGKGS